MRILWQSQEPYVPILHWLLYENDFVFRGEKIGKEFRLNDDRQHDQQVQDDGDPHRLAPSRSFSFVLEFFYKKMKFGGILRQVATQGRVYRRLGWCLSDWHSYSTSLTRLFWFQGRLAQVLRLSHYCFAHALRPPP